MCGEEIDNTVSARGLGSVRGLERPAGDRIARRTEGTKRIQKINGSTGQRITGSADQGANTTFVVHVNIRVDHDPSRH